MANFSTALAKPTLKDRFDSRTDQTVSELNACATVTPDPDLMEQLDSMPTITGETLFSKVPGIRQYTLFGEGNHSDLRIHNAFFNDKTHRAWARNGIKHLCLERADYNNVYYSMAELGIMDADAFAKSMSDAMRSVDPDPVKRHAYFLNEGRAVIALNKNGIDVHAVDQRHSSQRPAFSDEQKALLGNIFSRFNTYQNTHCPDIPYKNGKIWYGSIFDVLLDIKDDKEREEFMDLYRKTFDVAEDDTPLAHTIQSKVGDDKAVIYYGAAHGAKQNDLDELLGKGKCVKIWMFHNREQYADKWLDNLRLATDPAQFIYFITEDRAVINAPLDNDLKQAITSAPSKQNSPLP